MLALLKSAVSAAKGYIILPLLEATEVRDYLLETYFLIDTFF
jgi:hypothetical protein